MTLKQELSRPYYLIDKTHSMRTNVPDVPTYLAELTPQTRKLAKQLRAIIRKVAPKAEELISYGMPAYKLNGPLVYFAAYAKHIGFYPMPSAIEAFKKELSGYETAKGSIRFPLDQPLPIDLIEQIVEFRVLRNLEKPVKKKK